MALLFILAALMLSCSSIFVTVRRLRRTRSGWVWWTGFTVLAASGLAAGNWLAFYSDYQVSPRMRFCSFPIPLAFLHLEDGQWIDFITPPPVMYAGLVANVIAIIAVCLLPLLFLRFIVKSNSA